MQISDAQVERFCSAFYAHWDLTANDVARGQVRDAILTAFAATPEPISVQNMRQEMSLLISLFKHAIATPGYGQDPASREEAEDHIDSAGRALEAALSLPVQPVADAEPAGFFVLAEPGFKPFFCRSREDAEHTADNYRKYVNGCTSTSIDPLYRTPPVPPTKGPEDDLIAAREAYAQSLENVGDTINAKRAREGNRDSERAVQSALIAIRNQRSRPASALPVVGEAGKLAPGCCSAISPCSHQRHDPRSICDTCRAALTPTVQP